MAGLAFGWAWQCEVRGMPYRPVKLAGLRSMNDIMPQQHDHVVVEARGGRCMPLGQGALS